MKKISIRYIFILYLLTLQNLAFSQSSCTADFTYSANTSILTYSFVNTSYGLTDSFIWYFGDGTTDNGINPNHTYEIPGEYEICLTAYCSDGDSSSTCSTIVIYSGISSAPAQSDIISYPNPASNKLNLKLNMSASASVNITLMSILGEKLLCIYDGVIHEGEIFLSTDISSIPPGLYYVTADLDANRMINHKIVITK